MDDTSVISLYSLLDYFYNGFAVTFLMCLIGVVIGQVFKILYKAFLYYIKYLFLNFLLSKPIALIHNYKFYNILMNVIFQIHFLIGHNL